jgi:hypothetical protein
MPIAAAFGCVTTLTRSSTLSMRPTERSEFGEEDLRDLDDAVVGVPGGGRLGLMETLTWERSSRLATPRTGPTRGRPDAAQRDDGRPQGLDNDGL